MAEMDAAAQAAMAEAMAEGLRKFNTQLWTFYAFGVVVTILRTYSRIKAVGFKDLRADDYIIWLSILLYTTQSTLAFYAVNYGQGMANNGMTDAQRAALDPTSREYELRLFGSKVQVVGWTTYICLIFTLKLCVLFFYMRLMEGLSFNFRVRIWIGFGLLGVTFLASLLSIYAPCQPLSRYWQISPDPGNICQAAVALPIVWATFASSVVTDIYLIIIPLPMLWGTKLKLLKKILATFVLGAGVFVLVCSLLKTIFVTTDPINGAQLAGEWGTRETFVSVVTTNLPMLFPLVKAWLSPIFGSRLNSTKTPTNYYPSGFRTIGGGDGVSTITAGKHRKDMTSSKSTPDPDGLSFADSEESIVNAMKLQNLEAKEPKGIVVSSEFHIVDDKVNHSGERGQNIKQPHENW